MEYEEDLELTRYVWNHYSRLMTLFERTVGRAIDARLNAAATQSPRLADMLNRRWGGTEDAEVNAAIGDDPETFRRRVRDRVLMEFPTEVFVNRCPRCARVVRTPKARQCLWCGFDWHGKE